MLIFILLLQKTIISLFPYPPSFAFLRVFPSTLLFLGLSPSPPWMLPARATPGDLLSTLRIVTIVFLAETIGCFCFHQIIIIGYNFHHCHRCQVLWPLGLPLRAFELPPAKESSLIHLIIQEGLFTMDEVFRNVIMGSNLPEAQYCRRRE